LNAHLEEEKRRIAVARAVPLLMRAADLPLEGPDAASLRAKVTALADDLFVHIAPTEKPTQPLVARIAGEPVLNRGFSRSVGDNQLRSLVVTIFAVMLLMFALFRSLRMALLSMSASLLTLALIFGTMGMLHVPIDLGTSLVAGIATGAGSDYAMHYLW